MAISNAFTTSAKSELFGGLHDFGNAGASPIGGDTFKLALIQASAAGTYGAATANYSELNDSSPIEEAVDTSGSSPLGYKQGGGTLTNNGRTTSGTTAFVDFADITFTAVTLSADGCLIYNTNNGNSVLSVHAFGSTKTASGGDFTVQFPAADSSNAILRLA